MIKEFIKDEIIENNTNITILKPSNFLLPGWESINLIFEKPNELNDDLIVLHYWNQHSLKYLQNIKNFDWVINNSHTLYGKALLNVFSKLPLLEKTYFTCNTLDEIIDELKTGKIIIIRWNPDTFKVNNKTIPINRQKRLEKLKRLEILRQHEEEIKLKHEQLLKQMKEIEESHDEFENDENTNKESISTLNLKIEYNNENIDIENESIENESIENESIENESIENEDVENEDVKNEDVENEDLENDINNSTDSEKEENDKYYRIDPEWNSILNFDENIQEVEFD
mgnify:CR=1 FL=1